LTRRGEVLGRYEETEIFDALMKEIEAFDA
jgi:hypothetical protein